MGKDLRVVIIYYLYEIWRSYFLGYLIPKLQYNARRAQGKRKANSNESSIFITFVLIKPPVM